MTSITGIKEFPEKINHYFNFLGLEKEPFSTTPDPYYFFPLKQHMSCLTLLEISVRLRRGANLIIGEIGIGKTTLCRKLIQNLDGDSTIDIHLLLNPMCDTEHEFLSYLASFFDIRSEGKNAQEITALIKNYLFEYGVRKNKTILLIIDEAQKMTIEAIECLRGLLNYETNEYKLLQLILFAQPQLKETLKMMPNFVDRLNYRCQLTPLNLIECEQLIEFRLSRSGYHRGNFLLNKETIQTIHRLSNGYPRKMCMLMHKVLEQMMIRQLKYTDEKLVYEIYLEENFLNE